ncbi:MAG TPA: thiaminase II [Actinomycetes bacterium]|jgi:thiaminase/transcriptional activator TenA|nr:thiaminase II [Actinomycetes bacterium]
MAGLSERLFAAGRPALERQFAHPTVRGIAAGTLEEARFRAWLVQDYLFLLDYVRLFALAAARAPDTDALGRLVGLAHSTFHEELSLHRSYAAGFGLDAADLDGAEKTPVCAAYTDFLLRTAAVGDFAETVAALLPCMWGYSELGRAIAAAGPPAEPRYRRWVETYADPGFAELAAWCAGLLDRAAEGLPPARQAACERAFHTSLRHELAFWDV